MHSRKTVPIPDLMSAANMELIRLDFKSSTLSRHSKEFRSFSNYCRENEITAYDAETGPQYFQHCYGLDIGNSTAKLTKQQLDTRCSIRFLDDIFQFGYALRYSHHDYTVPRQYVDLLEEYLAWCHRNNSSDGTIRVKRTKIRQFFCFLDGRGIELSDFFSQKEMPQNGLDSLTMQIVYQVKNEDDEVKQIILQMIKQALKLKKEK